ncbi:MAG: LacI family DNA-binding transcriptional regulator [Anaerolineae bacterium]|nr:LacI family DNA-binding transcriptional regulator [Anaerolineae bacterium]
MPTIRDVAKVANVSTSTVSHVINETRYVSPETRERVLRAMQQLNYQHNRLASSLRNRKTHTIGVLVPNSANPYFAEILAGIEAACYEQDYHIIMGNANDDPEREQSYLKVLLSRQVDGILLISTGAFDNSIRLLSANKTPVVMVDRSAELATVDELFTDNRGGGRLATEYLLSLGHCRIGCITGPSFLTPSAARVQGYRDAFSTANHVFRDEWLVTGDFQHKGGYLAAQKLLAQDEIPTAIFACNDLMAVGAVAALQKAGLRVPHDISVIGYDDIPLASYANPRLTTIAQPARELGHLAVERLLERFGNLGAPARHDMLPVALIKRDSCSPFGES